MTKQDDISSTEKLLDLIRDDSKAGTEPPAKEGRPSKSSPPLHPSLQKSLPRKERKSLLSILPNGFSLKPAGENITVGVDISYGNIRLVKIAQPGDRKWRLLDFKEVPFDPDIPRQSPEFPGFLKQALTRFCGPAKNLRIWCSISTANVEVRQLLIPKVPKKQIANTVFWTFKKEVPFDEKETVFDFEVQGEITVNGGSKIAVLVYCAPKSEIRELKNLFFRANLRLTGITIAPFSIQNLFRTGWVSTGTNKTVCNLYIGRGWSRIDIFSEGNLVLIRGIKTGINSMAEDILEEMNKSQAKPVIIKTPDDDISLTLSLESESSDHAEVLIGQDDDIPVVSLTDKETFNLDRALKVLFSFSPDSPLSKDDPGARLTEDEKFEMVLPALERLIRQVERTFQHYSSVYERESVSKVYVPGTIGTCNRLVDYISDHQGIGIEVLDPLAPEIPFIGAVSTPRTIAERAAFTPALGLALSDNARTPNFLFTYKDKESSAKVNRIDRAVFAGFLVLVAICAGIYLFQAQVVRGKKFEIAELDQELALYSPVLDQNLILIMAGKVKQKRNDLRAYGKRYRGMAIISELTALGSDKITLLSSHFMSVQESGNKKEATEHNILVLEGFVAGERQKLESTLAGYIVRLSGSPVFAQPTVSKSTIRPYEGKDVLHFILNIDLS